MTFFESLESIVASSAEIVRPPERLTVSAAAEKYRHLNNPGSYVGPFLNSKTPYMIEPQDVLASSEFTGAIFVGPAQAAKTETLLLNWLSYTVVCDPTDVMLVNTSQASARDFSKRRIDRLHRHSREVGSRLITRRNSDNTFDKHYKSGMMLTLSWPTINELSGKPVPRMALTDYDRMPQNVDDEGSPFDLARKRTTTFGRFGMTLAESSPGFTVENPRWKAATAHEAPPVKGILSLYNRGDRRRYYWRCPFCSHSFEPRFELLQTPDTLDDIEAGEATVMVCPNCQGALTHEPDSRTGSPGKAALNRSGRWIKDGQLWLPDGTITGRGTRSDIASFWLMGVCAAFATWSTLVINYRKALREYETSGSDEALKTTVNVDQAMPYTPVKDKVDRLPEQLKDRARDLGERVVPHGVRLLLAAIDVQKNRFVVQVMGVGVGGDIYVVDRFEIKKSERLDPDGERYWVNPGSYLEDWDLLVKEVIEKDYPLGDGTGRRMRIMATGCDSGGREGVTANAYAFYVALKKNSDGKYPPDAYKRFQLLKGNPVKGAPRVLLSYPDSERKDRFAKARGEVPVLLINSNMIKDQLSKMLDRNDFEGGYIHFPDWLPDWFFTELTVEVRTPKGWENPKKYRNESWDLLAYCIALMHSNFVKIDRLDWTDPPVWAEEWDDNALVSQPDAEKRFTNQQKVDRTLEELASALA